MTKFISAVVIAFFLGLSSPVYSNELPSCDDLAEMANALEDMEGALKEVGTINEGDEVDKALEEVIDGLKVVALVEDDSHLSESVLMLSQAWEKMDGAALMSSLSQTIDDFDVIIGKECTK